MIARSPRKRIPSWYMVTHLVTDLVTGAEVLELDLSLSRWQWIQHWWCYLRFETEFLHKVDWLLYLESYLRCDNWGQAAHEEGNQRWHCHNVSTVGYLYEKVSRLERSKGEEIKGGMNGKEEITRTNVDHERNHVNNINDRKMEEKRR